MQPADPLVGSTKKLSVIVVTWQSKRFMDRCLQAFANRPDWLEVIVFDNDSMDGTADYVEERYPWVKLIRNPDNLGFGRANNEALKYCNGKYVLLLNPDAFLDNLDQVEMLIGSLTEDASVAAVGPQLIHPDGSHQVGDAGWNTSLRSVAGHVFWLHRAVADWPSIYLSNSSLLRRNKVQVDWICGACLLIRRDVFTALRGFNEDFFMYGEDVELGERIRLAGHKVIYVPHVQVLHLQGATQKSGNERYFSVKWMDARAKRYAANNTKGRYAAFKWIMGIGFAFRSVLLRVASLLSPRHRASAEMMARYAHHALNLPEHSAFRGSQTVARN